MSEMEAQLRRHRARRNEMGSAEGGLEIVESDLVGDVDGRQAQAPFVAFLILEKIVISHADIK